MYSFFLLTDFRLPTGLDLRLLVLALTVFEDDISSGSADSIGAKVVIDAAGSTEVPNTDVMGIPDVTTTGSRVVCTNLCDSRSKLLPKVESHTSHLKKNEV